MPPRKRSTFLWLAIIVAMLAAAIWFNAECTKRVGAPPPHQHTH